MTQYLETELKFKIKNPQTIQKILKKKGAKFLGKKLEKTFRFDTKNKELEKRGKFLRIRIGFKNIITFKQRIKSRDFKKERK